MVETTREESQEATALTPTTVAQEMVQEVEIETQIEVDKGTK